MNSSEHRANILNRSFRLIGLGAVQDGRGRWWVAQTFGARVRVLIGRPPGRWRGFAASWRGFAAGRRNG